MEIVKDDGFITGNLIALQIKSIENIQFSKEGNFSLGGIHWNTLNYWLGQLVSVFVLLINLSNEEVYWCNIRFDQRLGYYNG